MEKERKVKDWDFVTLVIAGISGAAIGWISMALAYGAGTYRAGCNLRINLNKLFDADPSFKTHFDEVLKKTNIIK